MEGSKSEGGAQNPKEGEGRRDKSIKKREIICESDNHLSQNTVTQVKNDVDGQITRFSPEGIFVLTFNRARYHLRGEKSWRRIEEHVLEKPSLPQEHQQKPNSSNLLQFNSTRNNPKRYTQTECVQSTGGKKKPQLLEMSSKMAQQYQSRSKAKPLVARY